VLLVTQWYTSSPRNPSPITGGGSPQFPGVLVGPLLPLAVRKCHQMPYAIKRAHATRLGRPLGIITHPGYPAAGRRGRVVPVPPLLLCTRPARARPSIGGQSPPSRSALRASSRGVLTPRGWCSRRVPCANSSRLLHFGSSRQIEIEAIVLPCSRAQSR
jgi:hypothetical protein